MPSKRWTFKKHYGNLGGKPGLNSLVWFNSLYLSENNCHVMWLDVILTLTSSFTTTTLSLRYKMKTLFPLTSQSPWKGAHSTPCLRYPAETDRMAPKLQGSRHPYPLIRASPKWTEMCFPVPGLTQPSRTKGASQAEDPRPHFITVNREYILPVSERRQTVKEKQTSTNPPGISPSLLSVTSCLEVGEWSGLPGTNMMSLMQVKIPLKK